MITTDVLIIGAGPTGLFAVQQLGLIGLKAEVVDNLDKVGGQCSELYPDKPIYDIPAIPECTGETLTKKLVKQIEPFNTNFHLGERVEQLAKKETKWIITTNKKKVFIASSIIIAGGVGSFESRKFPLKEAEKFENNGVFYSIKDKKYFDKKKICIFGGGDSALDWSIELSKNSKIVLVHRRLEFRGTPRNIEIIKKLEKNGKIQIETPYQINSIEGDDKIKAITIKDDEGKIKKIDTDYILGFFGLIMKLGPIAEWGLNLDKKHINVSAENFQTNKEGVFAIGDICTYPGKIKLILSSFHEGAIAARGCFELARPNEKYRHEFTTTSKTIHERLGKKRS
mgnify:FL=1